MQCVQQSDQLFASAIYDYPFMQRLPLMLLLLLLLIEQRAEIQHMILTGITFSFCVDASTAHIIIGYKSNGRYNNNMCFIYFIRTFEAKICNGFDFHGLYTELI